MTASLPSKGKSYEIYFSYCKCWVSVLNVCVFPLSQCQKCLKAAGLMIWLAVDPRLQPFLKFTHQTPTLSLGN